MGGYGGYGTVTMEAMPRIAMEVMPRMVMEMMPRMATEDMAWVATEDMAWVATVDMEVMAWEALEKAFGLLTASPTTVLDLMANLKAMASSLLPMASNLNLLILPRTVKHNSRISATPTAARLCPAIRLPATWLPSSTCLWTWSAVFLPARRLVVPRLLSQDINYVCKDV